MHLMWIPLFVLFLLLPDAGRERRSGDKLGTSEHLGIRKNLMTRRLLAAARANHGRLRLAEAVLALGSDFASTERHLAELVNEGRVEMDVDSKGRVVYTFPDFVDDRPILIGA